MLPVQNPRISQEYGRKSSDYRKGYHTGVDLVADENDKTVYNINPGVVIRSRFISGKKGADPDGWGNYVIVRQDDGHDVLYAHLYQVFVAEGKRVASGDSIGIQGTTGNSTGPHLHFEVWKGNWEDRNDINPAEYLGIKNTVGLVELLKPKYYEEVEVEVNGVILKGLIPKDEGRAYIQVRDLAEKFAGNLDWDSEKRRAKLEIFSENELKAKIHTLEQKNKELTGRILELTNIIVNINKLSRLEE
jgi:hypothetical protein